MSFTATTQNDNTNGTANGAGVAHTSGAAELVDRFGATQLVLLAVWSHPDDESFLAGGLLAEVTRRGGRVVNVSATAGEHGTDDPVANPPAALGAIRRRELADALAELGTDDVIHLGYGDGACHLVPDALGATAIGMVIDRVVPDVVLTFGPDGVTGHPDHQAISRWTRRAICERGDRIPLLTTAAASVWPADCIERMHTIGVFWPGFPQIGAVDEAIVLDGHLLDRKLAALGRHASQMAPVEAALGLDGFRAVAAAEAYRAANRAARDVLQNSELLALAA